MQNGQKMGKKHFWDLRFFGTHFCVKFGPKKICGFFAFWGLGLIHFVATARNCAYLGLWDCSPFLHRGLQMSISWTLGLQSIAQMSTNNHGSGLPAFQQTSSKLVHNSAHGTQNAALSFHLDNSAWNAEMLWGTSTATFKNPCPELAPISALGHINSHIQISTSCTSTPLGHINSQIPLF